MHIVLYHFEKIPPSHYGGTERIVYWLAKGLLELGHEVTLFCKEGSTLPGAHVIELTDSDHAKWADMIPASANILHLQATPGASFSVKLPFIVTIHGNGQANETFLPNSVFLSKRHAQNHGAEIYVHNGIDTQNYFSEPKKSDNLVFLAKASWSVKNLQGAVRVAKLANRKLIVLGSRTWPFHLKRRLNTFLNSQVQFYGMADDNEKRKFLSTAAGLVFPVRWHEPFGLAVIEAQASGCPIFGTPYGSLPELVPPTCGTLSSDAQTLAKAIERQSYSPAECVAHANSHFSYQLMAKRYLELYEKVISGKPLHTYSPRTCEESLISRKLLNWT